jgi:hypothetical protein
MTVIFDMTIWQKFSDQPSPKSVLKEDFLVRFARIPGTEFGGFLTSVSPGVAIVLDWGSRYVIRLPGRVTASCTCGVCMPPSRTRVSSRGKKRCPAFETTPPLPFEPNRLTLFALQMPFLPAVLDHHLAALRTIGRLRVTLFTCLG